MFSLCLFIIFPFPSIFLFLPFLFLSLFFSLSLAISFFQLIGILFFSFTHLTCASILPAPFVTFSNLISVLSYLATYLKLLFEVLCRLFLFYLFIFYLDLFMFLLAFKIIFFVCLLLAFHTYQKQKTKNNKHLKESRSTFITD